MATSRPAAMTGSYAGAMGQPQFMPTSYLRYAVDFEGHGRRDIWTSKPDVLGSIANYLAAVRLARRGRPGARRSSLPPGVDAPGRDAKRPLAEWARAGVRPVIGRWAAHGRHAGRPDRPGRCRAVRPSWCSRNFAAIRRYNPSDFYAIAVGPDR